MKFDSRIPIYLQVIDSIKQKMVAGDIKPGDKLPSTRNLALEYNVNPNTASRIYKEIEQMDLCFTKRGLGTFATESIEIVDNIKIDMAKKVTDAFIKEMKALGYDEESMINNIKKEFID